MANREAISMEDLELVTGGAIGWSKRNMTFTIMDSKTREVKEAYKIVDGMWDKFVELKNTYHNGYGGTYTDSQLRDLLKSQGVIR